MYNKILCSVLLLFSTLAFSQGNNDVELVDFIREIQVWNKQKNNMTLAWWIPKEYWRVALKQNQEIPEEVIRQLEKTTDDYVLIWVADCIIAPPIQTMKFASKSELGANLKLQIDGNTKNYFPLNEDNVNQEAKDIAENLKPFFVKNMGELGQGMHYFFFKKDDELMKKISASNKTSFKLFLFDSVFSFKLPIDSVLPPKFCPIDNSKMKGSWSFCPIHGSKL